MVITKENCLKLILEKFPDFYSSWHAYTTEWNSYKTEFPEIEICGVHHTWSDTSLFGEMAEFSSYVSDLLIQEKSDSFTIKEIFSYMEYLLVTGDDEVQTVVSTCFLENILNKTPEQIDPTRFVQYLGTASRVYCQAWDKFTGVYTEGLWSKELNEIMTLNADMMTFLSFPDFEVIKMDFKPCDKALNIYMEGAWLDLNGGEKLGKGVLLFENWISLTIQTFDSTLEKLTTVDLEKFEPLRDICEIIFTNSSVTLCGFTKYTGLWTELNIYNASMHAKFEKKTCSN